jgi:hypothetical protein
MRDFDPRVTALARHRSNCTVNYRPVLSSEREQQNKKTRNCLKEISRRKKNWSRVPDGYVIPRQTGQLTVGRKLTSTSTSTSYHQLFNTVAAGNAMKIPIFRVLEAVISATLCSLVGAYRCFGGTYCTFLQCLSVI